MRLLCNFHHSGYFLDIVLYIYDCKHIQTLNKLKDLLLLRQTKVCVLINIRAGACLNGEWGSGA